MSIFSPDNLQRTAADSKTMFQFGANAIRYIADKGLTGSFEQYLRDSDRAKAGPDDHLAEQDLRGTADIMEREAAKYAIISAALEDIAQADPEPPDDNGQVTYV